MIELEQSRWLTPEEVEQYAEYKDFDSSWGSVDILGSPCSDIKQRFSAKHAPSDFNKGNR